MDGASSTGTTEAASVDSLLRAVARAPQLAPGPQVGEVIGDRFRVERKLGAGGMSVVYLARDLRLRRPVALKVHSDGDGSRHTEREARLLARLVHPNVVTVHDVGSWRGRIYIAMEYLDGGTARHWCDAAPRSWREILDVYLAAGRGLAAAHAAGLVHRDVKPDNILIGADGRARIGDFGIARWSPDAPPVTTMSADATSLPPRIAGTPRYMAPEQGSGAIDARADQFSFCVALDEALAGAPGVPARLSAVIARGRLPRPDDRWASMETLLATLERAAARRRRRWLAAAALIAIAATGATTRDRGHRPALCGELDTDLDGTWPAERRARATGPDDGSRAELDFLAATWNRQRAQVCEAERRDPAMSDEMLERAAGCLGSMADRIGRLVPRVESGAPGLRELLSAHTVFLDAQCTNPRFLVTPAAALPDAANRARIAALDDALALYYTGAPRQGLVAARAVLAATRAPALAHARRWALSWVSLMERGLQEHEAARAHLRELFVAARAAGDAWLAMNASWNMASIQIEAAAFDDAADWASYVRADAEHLGLLDRRTTAIVLALTVDVPIAIGQRRFADALAICDRNIAVLEAGAVADSAPRASQDAWAAETLAPFLVEKAQALVEAGRPAEALPVAQRALDLAASRVGAGTAADVRPLRLIGLAHDRLGDRDRALDALARARTIAEAELPADSGDRARAVHAHASMIAARDPAAALPLLEEARAIYERAFGRNHVAHLRCLEELADLRVARGDAVPALALRRDALAIAQRLHGPTHRDVARLLLGVGVLEAGSGDDRAAVELARGVAMADELGVSDLRDLSRARAWLGRAHR